MKEAFCYSIPKAFCKYTRDANCKAPWNTFRGLRPDHDRCQIKTAQKVFERSFPLPLHMPLDMHQFFAKTIVDVFEHRSLNHQFSYHIEQNE